MLQIKKILFIGVIIASVLFALVFIPENVFLGIDSYHPSPSPMEVYENVDDGFKITPIWCDTTDSGLTESKFQITNSNDADFDLNVNVSFTDNDGVLYEKDIKVRVLAGQTVDQSHLSDKTYDDPICVVRIDSQIEI